MRILIMILMLTSLVFGYNYNNLLLKAQASIFPKIILLDKKIEDKLVNGKVVYTIVYDKDDYKTARKVRDLIDANHNGHFDKYQYKINLVEYSNLSTKTQATAFYALNSDKNIHKIATITREKGIVAFAYDIANLKQGLLFSLMFEKSTVLYINKENLYTNKIDFVDSLYQIVRFLDKDNG